MFANVLPALLEQFVVEVGTIPIDVAAIKGNLKQRKVLLLPGTECLFEQVGQHSMRPGKYRLHCRSIESFGLSGLVTLQKVYSRALSQGLIFCDVEVLIRLLELPRMIIHKDTECLLAMKPIDDGTGRLFIPHIRGDVKTEQDVRPMVRMTLGSPFAKYKHSTQMVFCTAE